MPSIFILIVVFSAGYTGGTTVTQEFYTQESCDAVKNKIISTVHESKIDVALCMPK